MHVGVFIGAFCVFPVILFRGMFVPFWPGLCVCSRVLACSVEGAWGGLYGQVGTYLHQLYVCMLQAISIPAQGPLLDLPLQQMWPSALCRSWAGR